MGTSPSRPRHALLLPGSIGMGHQVLAASVGEALGERGWTSSTADVMAMLGGAGQVLGERAFPALLSTPGGFDALRFAALRQGSAVADWHERRGWHAGLEEALRRCGL